MPIKQIFKVAVSGDSSGAQNLRVGIDAHMVGGQETGNETYIRGLVGELASGPDDLTVFHVGLPWTQPRLHLRFQQLLTSNPYLRLGFELPVRSLGHRLDLLHLTYAAPVWSAVPLVITVHDICYTTNPEWFSRRDLRVLSRVVPRSLRRAAHIITDSNSVRSEIIERYGVPADKISAIPIGPGPASEPITADEARHELASLNLMLERPYLLAVGNLQPRKNLVRLMQAFARLVSDHGHDIDLVIVGPRQFRADDIFRAAEGMEERIHFTGYVNNRQLAACYSRCSVFVFPSLYEGFGLPVIEAMAHRVPVACSNTGALPEVCGDATLMFDPHSVDAMADVIDRILRHEDLRRSLQEAGLKRSTEFSWVKSAAMTRKVYHQAASKN